MIIRSTDIRAALASRRRQRGFFTLPGGMGAARPAGGGTPWTPSNLGAVPFAWYNDLSSMTLTGSSVDNWGDQGSGGYNLAQSISGAKPTRIASGLNGRRTVQFDGTGDYMTTAGLVGARQPFKNVSVGYIACLYKKTAAGAGANQVVAINYTGAGGSRLALACNDSVAGADNRPRMTARRLDADSAANLSASSGGSTSWQMVVVTMDWANGDGTIYINGAQDVQNLSITSSGSTSNTDGNLAFALGATASGTNFSDIEVAEYLHGAYLPSADEIDKLFGYLAHRWGLTADLPALHPYKTTPPYI